MSKDVAKRQNNLGVMLATKPSIHTRKAYKRALDSVAQLATNGTQLAHQFPFELLSPTDAQKLLVALSVDYSASTTGITLAALRAYWKQAWMNDDILGGVKRPPARAVELREGRVMAGLLGGEHGQHGLHWELGTLQHGCPHTCRF